VVQGGCRLLTRLIGRDADARELVRMVDRVRLLTLVGAPGCGKTRLGMELGTRLAVGLPRSGGHGL